jgi:universal stress protein A
MLPIRIVLHPTDFSDRSENAFRLACALARDYDARLVILHVADLPVLAYGEGVVPPDPEIYQASLRDQLEGLHIPIPGLRVERRFEEGDPPAEILRVADEIGADLIVLGTHGRTGLGRLLMGSVAERVMRKATCPVLTVKTPFEEAPVRRHRPEKARKGT